LNLPDDFYNKVAIYKEHLFKWNKTHNLTGVRDEATLDEFIDDAVFPVTFLPKVKNILDIGSGAGFPGMMLAFALKDTEVTLVEPRVKRAGFLQFVKADLDLKNVKVVKSRVEEMRPEIFELITSRAVTDTKMLLKLSENFRDDNSKLLFYKGERVFEELADTKIDYKIIEREHSKYLLMGKNI